MRNWRHLSPETERWSRVFHARQNVQFYALIHLDENPRARSARADGEVGRGRIGGDGAERSLTWSRRRDSNP
jgi:hypothetical protein